MGWEQTVIDMGNPQILTPMYVAQQELLARQAEVSYKAGYDARDKEIIAKSRQLGHGHSQADAILIAHQEGRREVVAYIEMRRRGDSVVLKGDWKDQKEEWEIE